MINGSSAPTSVNNYTVKNCTFDGNSTAHTAVTVASTSAGKIVIEGCTFANLNQDYVINPNNQNGGAMEVVVTDTKFENCGKEDKAVIRVAGEKAGTSATVTLDSLTFDTTSAPYAIGIGKKQLSENNADITYTITNTEGTLSVFMKGGTADTITPETTDLIASETYKGANFVDPRTFGYDLDGDGTLDALPTAPDMSGTVVNVNAANAQYVLDGAYGSIDGKTINFTESITETLILGRAAKYDGSGTVYRHGSFEGDAMSYANFIAYKSQSGWTEYSYYERTVENVTFTADNGVTIAGFNAEGGNHVYGTTEKPLYDHVRDTSSKDTNNGYYKRTTLKNFTFDGLTFTAKTDISTSNNDTVYDGFTFTGCTFNINNGTTDSTDYQAIRYYDEGNSGNLKNLVVEGCEFNGCYQGVYAVHVNGVKVTDSTFTTMYHNAIAIQTTTHGACDFGSVVINGNTFSELNDRAIRFGAVAAGTQITIKNNVVESTTSTEECIKVSGGEALPDGVTFDVDYNDWGTYLPPSPAQLSDTTMVAKIGTTGYSTLSAAFNAATEGQTVKLLTDLTDETCALYDLTGVTFDLNGFAYSHYNAAHAFQGTGGAIKNGKMICLDGGSYALFLGCDVGATTSFTVENVEMTGGINMGYATGVVLTELNIKAQNYYAVWLEANSAATIESGTYESTEVAKDKSLFNVNVDKNVKSVLTLAGGTFKTIGNSLMGSSGGTLVVTGGKFDADVATPYLDSTKELETYEGSDGFYAVKTTTSEVLTVNAEATEAGTTETKTVEVALTEDVIKAALEKAGADTGTTDSAAKVEALNKEDTNGNPVWVNIVAGIESDKSVAVDAAQNTDAATIDVTPMNIGAVASGMNVQIAYEVDEVTVSTTSDGKQTATVAKQGDAVSDPAIDVDSVETSAYFQVKVLVRQNGSTIASVPATNYIGVLKKSTKATKALVPVPWHSLADGGDISVSNVVKTANLTDGDTLSVYVAAEKKYNVYELKSDKTWEPKTVYKIDANGQVSASTGEAPDTMSIPRGSGVWLERSNTDTPIVTYGLASATKQTTEIAKATQAEDGTVTKTWSLAAVPTTESVALSTLAAPEKATEDTVIVPTEGAPIVYTVKDGAWGYDETVTIKDSNGNATGIVTTERKTDATLPAGTGFWYVNGGGEKSVEW